MMCLKCGNEIKDNEQICGNCGHNKNNKDLIDNAYATVNRGIYNPEAITKEESEKITLEQKQFDQLLQAYIGNMYYNFKKGSFSWCSFFLTYIYFLYRKLYAVGGIVYIINLIISLVFRKNLLLLSTISLLFNLFLGITFKRLYFNECVERVGRIKKENPNLGFNQLIELARRKGGVNTIIIIPFTILFALTTITIILTALLAAGIITSL